MTSVCIRCGGLGNLQCSRCRSVNYCGVECQREHWKRGHKGECSMLVALRSNQPKEYITTNTTPSTQSKATTAKGSKKPNKTSPQSPIPTSKESSQTLFDPKRINLMMTFIPEIMGVGTGLHNVGNSCYLNAVLQCLTYTLPLSNYFLQQEHTSKCNIKEFCMLCEMERHAVRVLSNYRDAVLFPKNIYMNIPSLGDFVYFRQEDAHDFTYCVLNAMQQSILRNAGKVDRELEETSLIYQIFGGKMQSQLKCTSCSNVSTSFDSFLDLSLEISSCSSVEEALQAYTSIETISDYRCDKCNQKVDVQKQLTIFTPPNILVATLKRFDLMNGGGKINKPVVYREELDLKRVMSQNSQHVDDCKYELYATIVHYGGSVFAGHYVAFIKVPSRSGDTWWLFDDTNLTPINQSVVLKQNAYMLFYKKSNTQDPKRIIKKDVKWDQLPSISATSSATSSKQIPKYRAYEGMTQDGSLQIIITMEVPLLVNIADCTLDISESGSFVFTHAVYQLKMKQPIMVNTEKVTAKYYTKEGVIAVLLPMASSVTGNATKRIEIQAVDGNHVDELDLGGNEISIEAEALPTNVEETTYSKLYHEILNNKNMSMPLKKSSDLVPKSQPKVGRNDLCPCGSGKKYKKCHGK